MRRSFFMLALSIAAAVALAAPAHAGIMMSLGMSLTPSSGVPGTAVTLSSTDPCPPYTGGARSVVVANQPDLVNGPFLGTATVAADGSWSFDTTIDTNATIGTDITFYAECQGENAAPALVINAQPGWFTLATYTPVIFSVTAPPTTTTTTTSTSTTTTTAPAAAVTMKAVPDFLYEGESCLITASGFMPGSSVEIIAFSTPFVVGTVVADANGDIAKSWQIPAGFEVGIHTMVLRGTNTLGAAVEVSANITIGALVEQQPTTTGSLPLPVTLPPVRSTGTLPRTGSELITPLVLGGALLLAGGAGAMLVARRQRRD